MEKQRPFGELVPYDEALSSLLKEVEPVDRKETIYLDDAFERVLANDVESDMFVPPFDRAAMDGFAVKAKDTFDAGKFDPVDMKNVDKLHAGDSPEKALKKGECIQIATGAPMPEGADAVVKVEVTEKENDLVNIYQPVHPGENVSPKGEDIEKDETVLKNGLFLTSSRIGALAAMGKEKVGVYEKPKIGIIPTGDEVVPIDGELGPGQIYDVNSHTLTCVVNKNGCRPFSEEVVHDSIEGLKEGIRRETGEMEMVIFSGGSSVGDKDILIDALDSIGEVIFHGVKLKPGKPTLFGKVEGTPVLGMPGYPTSCLNTAQQLIKPVLRKLSRLPEPSERHTKAVLQKRITSSLGRQQYMTIKLEDGMAHPVYKQSGAITSMAKADGYFEIPENVELVEKGDKITVTLF
ncbi:MAG: molybdenum cofactor biosynthesis protein [Candidatus Thermoplasmatota archaeon]|nr:molybdenum cofactor biosynthesis protein [Candidatus Thermoplasmatota archaeon]MBS3789307.1 molybdenum cofactor biosynthesis protein [Candidatus Thermoplasmatota archaeon]